MHCGERQTEGVGCRLLGGPGFDEGGERVVLIELVHLGALDVLDEAGFDGESVVAGGDDDAVDRDGADWRVRIVLFERS